MEAKGSRRPLLRPTFRFRSCVKEAVDDVRKSAASLAVPISS